MGIFDCFKIKRAGIFVDGPNMLRKETHLDLAVVKNKAKQYSNVEIANVYLDQFAKEKLLEAVINQGFNPVISSGDVDIAMSTDMLYYTMRRNLSHVIVVSRDADFVYPIRKVKELGRKVIVISKRMGFSSALKNYADEIIFL